MSTTNPIEGKVWAATVGTGAGAVVSGFVVWLLGVLVWQAPFTSEGATQAVASVPGPVVAIVGLVITVGGAFIGGYSAKHTPRPQPDVQPEPDPARAFVQPELDPRDLDQDGRDDTTGRFVAQN